MLDNLNFYIPDLRYDNIWVNLLITISLVVNEVLSLNQVNFSKSFKKFNLELIITWLFGQSAFDLFKKNNLKFSK